VTSSLQRLILGLASLAIVVVMLSGLAIDLRDDIETARGHTVSHTRQLAAAGAPLLLNALVVGDLASAEQMLRGLNSELLWGSVRLYEADGTTLMLDASPVGLPGSRVPRWLRRLVALEPEEFRFPVAADPVVYAVLAVQASSRELEQELWDKIVATVGLTAALLAALVLLMRLILAYGLRPVRALGATATRFGQGDFSVRLPETALSEIAPTVRAFNTMADRVERLLAELRAKEVANRRLAAVVEQSEEAILTVGPDGRLTSWNLGAQQLFGRGAAEMLGQPLASLFAAPDAELESLVGRLLGTRPPDRLELAARREFGAECFLAVAASPLRDEDGRPAGHIVVARDITRRKLADDALRRAKEAAEAADRAKAEFLATMSHEIRTPMNGIIGVTALVLETDLTPEQREYLGLVRASADDLLRVINDILDFSKIEAGRMDLDATPFALRATLGHTLKSLALRAQEMGLELAMRVVPEVPDWVVGDPGRLRQVVVNLIGNAIKFTERGEVVLRIDVASTMDDEIEIHFAVSDTGVGIPAPKRALVFEPFTQVDGSSTRRHGGTGLGLAISRRLVALLGGRIWVESELGQGSTFHFTARFRRSDVAASPRPVASGRLQGLDVLVVDDNSTSGEIVADVLRHRGLKPVVVGSADAAWTYLEATRLEGRRPSVVVLDDAMPGPDPLGLVERLRATPDLQTVGIVVVSGSGSPRGAARARALGAETYLTKPVLEDELVEALEAIVSPGAPAREDRGPRRAVAAASPAGHKLRVLVAEDNTVNQKVASRTLEREGHDVVVVDTGRAALAALEAEAFDLVLMDVQMPEMDGFEATAAIRAWEADVRTGLRRPRPGGSFALPRRHGRIPIVALTAYALRGDDERCRAAGMDGYVSKPIDPDALSRTLERFGTGEAGGSGGAASSHAGAPIDRVAALRAVGGDPGLLSEAGRLFVEECPRRLRQLQDALAAGAVTRFCQVAHSLGGAAATLGADATRHLAARLESLGREGRLDDAAAVLVALERNLADVTELISQPDWTAAIPA
jgi:PAS domain S-box-containing protein